MDCLIALVDFTNKDLYNEYRRDALSTKSIPSSFSFRNYKWECRRTLYIFPMLTIYELVIIPVLFNKLPTTNYKDAMCEDYNIELKG